MLLPAMLVRDYGFWGWVAFAVPNVLGAAAMGWVIASREAARRLVFEHRLAVVVFSVVTLAYHAYVMLALFAEASPLAVLLVIIAAVWALGGAQATGAGVILRAAGVTLAVSLTAWWLLGQGGARALSLPDFALWPGQGGTPGAASVVSDQAFWHWLAFVPAAISGFALCPYLDATFLQARMVARSPRDSRVAFGVGFGVVFFAMIVLSLLYAGLAGRELDLWWTEHRVWAPGAWYVLLGHVVVQAMFTGLVHVQAVRVSFGQPVAGAAMGLAVVVGLLAFGLLTGLPPRVHGISSFEVVYRCFLLCYGVAFPAYVWLFMVPDRVPGPGGLARSVTVVVPAALKQAGFGVACVVGLAMGYVGFVMGQAWAVLAAVAVVGLSKPGLWAVAALLPSRPHAIADFDVDSDADSAPRDLP